MSLKMKWKKWVNELNDKGIPIPLIRDHGVGSVSLTLVVLSSIWVQIGFIGKLTGFLGGFDSSNAMYWFMSCAALYWGRKVSKDGDKTELGDAPAEESDSDSDPK